MHLCKYKKFIDAINIIAKHLEIDIKNPKKTYKN